jgi:aspartyl-tRNA(Asn)/glutamyl-tRNA(Gln) amidotransferase subunit A
MARFDEALFFSTVVELNKRLIGREFSAVELARAFCDRLEQFGPRYNALALPLRDTAMRAAAEADKQIKRGRTRGPLQGMPFGVKDLLSVAGRPTEWGARPFAGQVFDRDATAVTKLAKAGGILIGKLAMVQLAGGGGYRFAAASATGPGLNPWDRDRWSGGSSSGCGSAVAAGLVPFALGSETNGSIVTPSAFCGITGLRPTYGLVSRAGAMALSWTLDKIGPMARSAEDCGHILDAIAGADSKDPGSAKKGFHFAPQYARAPGQLKLGFSPADFGDFADEPLRAPLAGALETLRNTGAELKEIALPDLPYGPAVSTIIAAEAATIFADIIRDGRIDTLNDARQAAGLKAGLEISASDYLQAMRIRRLAQEALAGLFSGVDVIVSPARYGVAPPVKEPLDRPSGTSPARQGGGTRAIVSAGNLAGMPALVVPAGLAGTAPNALPVALCLTGRPFSENTLLRLGMEFQTRTDWHRRRPVM